MFSVLFSLSGGGGFANHVSISSFGLLVLSGLATAKEAGELVAGGNSDIVRRGAGQSGSRAGHFGL